MHGMHLQELIIGNFGSKMIVVMSVLIGVMMMIE